MSSLGDKLWRDMGGDVPADPQTVARQAIQRHGSGRAAARALGVDEAQIRRWRDGKVRNSPNVARIAEETRRIKARDVASVDVTIRHAKRTRPLTFGAGEGKRGLSGAALAGMKEAYARGDREAIAREFLDGVTDGWYQASFTEWYEAELAGEVGEAGETSGAVGLFIA